MAKVIGPLNSTEARGGLGALIYNTWRGIATVKRFTSPAQPRTTRQLAVRGYLTTLSRDWAGLTQVQRDGWNAYAAAHPVSDWTGNPKRITGENMFIKCNTIRLDLGLASVDTAPATTAPAAVAGLALTPGAGQISIAFTAYGGTDTSIDVWIQPAHSLGQLPRIQKARHLAYAPGETTPYVATGLVPGNTTVYIRGVDEASGLCSLFVSDSATVT
jgi:hypothetical protein